MRTSLLALALASPAGLAAAQDCTDDLRALTALTGPIPLADVAALTTVDGWCTLPDLRLGGERAHRPAVTIDRLRWQLGGPVTGQDGTVTLPRSIDLAADGLRLGTTTGDPVTDWLMAAQQQPAPIAVDLSVTVDPDAGTIAITEFAIDFPGENAVGLTASATGLSLSDTRALIASLPQVRLQALDLTVTTNGLFENYVLMPLGAALFRPEGDPAAELAAFQTAASARIAALPERVLPAPGKAALIDLVADLPNPAGTIRMRIDVPGGWGAERLAPVLTRGVQSLIDDPAPLFDGVEIAFSYDRSLPEGNLP